MLKKRYSPIYKEIKIYRSKDKELYDNKNTQYICCLNGGILVQNCQGHAIGRTHPITNGKEVYEITSTHHQMQFPYFLPKENYDVLYWADTVGYNHEGDKINVNLIQEHGEPEIVLYHTPGKPRCLAIQGHPEIMYDAPVVKMLNNLIKELCK